MNEIPPIAPRELSELVHSKDTSSHPSISRVVSDCSSHSFGRGLVSRERDQAVGSRQTIVGSVAKMLDEMREDQVAAQSQSFPPPAMSKSELPHVLDPKTATFAFHPNPSEGAESALENEVQQKNPLTSVKVDVGYNKKPWSEQANPGSPTGVHLECPDYFQGNGPVVVKPAMTVGVDFGTKFSAVTAYEPRSGPTFSPGRLDRIAYHLPRQPSVPIVPICNESVYATAGTTRCNAGEMNWPHAKMATSNDKPFPGNPAPPCHHDKPYADHALATHQRELVKAKKAQEELLRARGGTKCVKIHRCSTIRISRRPITTARVLRPAVRIRVHTMAARKDSKPLRICNNTR